jgi:hypothetical protein
MKRSTCTESHSIACWLHLLVAVLSTVCIGISAGEEPSRVWTDVSGRQITATLVDSDEKSVRLRKPGDSNVYTVALERLSAADRLYIRSINMPTDADRRPAAQPRPSRQRPPEPSVSAPKAMPALSKWNKSLRDDVERAARLRSTDAVSALLLFKTVHDRKKDGPTPSQKIWLSEQISALTPTALATLRRDYEQAAKESNLLDMLLVQVVSNKIAKGSIDVAGELTVVKNRVFTGQGTPEYVWKVDQPLLENIDSPYTEGGSFNRFTLSSKNGFRLVRVKARVTNVSRAAEKPYGLFAFEPIKAAIAPIFHKPEDLPGKYRWIDDSFVYLLTPASDLIPCSHVIEGCTLRSVGSMTVSSPDGSGRVISLPQPLQNAGSIDIDVIFSVPNDLSGFRLFVFGAAPIPVRQQ